MIYCPYLLVPGGSPYLQPFHQPECPESAMTFQPDIMEHEEEHHFPKFTRNMSSYRMYLGIRNLILGLWSLNFKVCISQAILSINLPLQSTVIPLALPRNVTPPLASKDHYSPQ